MSTSPDTDSTPALDPDSTRRYVVGECVGTGGLGSVYRAWDTHLGRWVAIKRLTMGAEGAPADAAARLRREANALAALQHPHIVTVHDVNADADGPFVVMEFIEGETLETIAARAPLDEESFGTLAVQSLGAVEAAHRAGLLHRDLKPGNIMLTGLPDGGFTVKVLDFGLAKFAPRPAAQTIEQGDSLFGSIYFMAPEQFRREPLDVRSDLYALGAVFFYSLTGMHPFDGDTTAQVIAAHLDGRLIRPLAQLRPDLPPPLAAWVERLLSRSPTQRPASAAAALTLARPFLAGALASGTTRQRTGATPMVMSSPEMDAPRPPRRWLWPVVGTVAVLLLTAAGIIAARTFLPRPTPPPATTLPAPAAAPAPATAAVPPATGTPKPAQAAPATAVPEGTLQASDIAGLRAHLNQTATVTGTPLGVGQTRAGTVFYLNFGARPHEGLAVVCFASGAPGVSQEDFRVFVGKPVTVQGKLGDFKGDLQLVIQSPADVRLTP